MSDAEATATFRRRPRRSHPNGSDFTLQESSTVKRRPKSRDKEPECFTDPPGCNGDRPAPGEGGPGPPNTTQPLPYQNGTSTVKRRPTSEVTEQPQPQPPLNAAPQRDSDLSAPPSVDGGPARKPKPPVSPKPVVSQIKRQGTAQTPPQPAAKRVPLPGPGTPGSPGARETITHQQKHWRHFFVAWQHILLIVLLL